MVDRLAELVTRLQQFTAERDWAQFHDPKNLAMAVASEAGELLAEYRWVANTDADAWSRESANKNRVAMEAADVGIALLLLCDRIGVDLPIAIENKIELNAQNYPVSASRGRALRPNR